MKCPFYHTCLIGLPIILTVYSCKTPDQDKKNTSQSQDTIVNNSFTLKGQVQGADTGWVYFMKEDTINDKPFGGQTDSAKITKGSFSFTGETEVPYKVTVGIKAVENRRPFFSPVMFIDRGETFITFSAKPLLSAFEAKGSYAQNLFNEFNTNYKKFLDSSNALFAAKMRLKKTAGNISADSLDRASEAVEHSTQSYFLEFAGKYPASIVSAYIINEYLKFYKWDPLVFYRLFTDSIKASYYGRQIELKAASFSRTNIGSVAPDFTIPDANGKPHNLRSLLSTYTLIDFWASWCKPCRAENPFLLKAFNQYKNKGFTIISVSMDNNRQDWLRAIKDDNLPWKQLSDIKGNESPVKLLYGVYGIPRNFLLNEKGQIIAKDLRGEKLGQKLREVIPD